MKYLLLLPILATAFLLPACSSDEVSSPSVTTTTTEHTRTVAPTAATSTTVSSY